MKLREIMFRSLFYVYGYDYDILLSLYVGTFLWKFNCSESEYILVPQICILDTLPPLSAINTPSIQIFPNKTLKNGPSAITLCDRCEIIINA